MDTIAHRSCVVCNKSDDIRLCNRCKNARYCSPACQQSNWPTHKLFCSVFSSFDVSSRPTPEHSLAILFPVDDKKPKPIWLHCKWNEDEGSKYQLPNSTPFLGPDAFPRDLPIQYNPVRKRQLSNTLYVCHRDTFLVDGSKPNKSIVSITSTNPGQHHDWRGPIIAYGKVGLGIDPIACKDIDMNDFQHITDYFLSYGHVPPSAQQSVGSMVMGVRINCLGDQKMLCKPHFEAVEVPITDSIFEEHEVSDIAERVGLSIYTRRCLPDPKWANDEDNQIFEHTDPFSNQDATFLHLCCDPKAEFDSHTGMLGWAWASQQWQNKAGSITVVRQDKKPLLPSHVEALCKYCGYEIRPLLAHSIGEYAPEDPMSKDNVLAMISRPTFVIYWYKFLDEKGIAGDVPYPFDG